MPDGRTGRGWSSGNEGGSIHGGQTNAGAGLDGGRGGLPDRRFSGVLCRCGGCRGGWRMGDKELILLEGWRAPSR